MKTIRLTTNDISEMVKRAVHAILNESIEEVQGSAMADKEEVIQNIVDYIKAEWEKIKKEGIKPDNEDTYVFDDDKGVRFEGIQRDYVVIVPNKLLTGLGLAERFDLNVAIQDFTVPEDHISDFGSAERATQGCSYGDPKNNAFARETQKFLKSRVDLYIPSVNGELQTTGFVSSLYHELNHIAGRLSMKKKHQYLDDDELDDLQYFSASRRAHNPAHFMTHRVLHQQPSFMDWLYDDKSTRKLKKQMSYLFYAVWETTERNARAEAVYGELGEMGITRENFHEMFPKTELYRQITEMKDIVTMLDAVPLTKPDDNSKWDSLMRLWSYAGDVMNMRPKQISMNTKEDVLKFLSVVKKRFLSRSLELINELYKKSMKVCELYFQRHEAKPEKSRLQQYKDRKKIEDLLR